MSLGRFCVLSVLAGFCIFGVAFAAFPDDAKYGPNLLRSDRQVQVYQQDEQGVPTFVKGKLSTPATRGSELAAAIQFLEQNRGAYRIANPATEIVLRKQYVEENGMSHLRLDQYYQGIKVISGELVAHFNPDGTLRTINGHTTPDLNMDVNPSYPSQGAVKVASDDLKSFFGEGRPGDPELVIFPWDGQNHLAYRLFIYSDTPMGRWEYFVDAKSAEVIFKANRIMDTDAIGSGVGSMGVTRSHLDTDFTGATYQMRNNTRQVGNHPHGHVGQMPGSNNLQTNIAGSSLPGTIAVDPDNNWIAGGSQAAAVDGHVYSAQVYDWWLAAFNRNSYNNAGASMLTVVNYSGEGDNNAYWDGSRIVVWSAGAGWRSLAGCPDVIAHEWGHAVTETESGLVYQKEPGALNESFSDMMGAAFEWAHDTLDTPDWLMGENGQTSGAGFRSMSNPHAYGDPDYYGTTDGNWVDVVNCTPSQFNDYCGVHTNSGVGNKWYFLLSDGGTHHSVTVDGIGPDKAIEVAYRANALYWTSGISYMNAALATVDAAEDLEGTGAWATEVSKAWNAVGVAVPLASLAFSYPNGVPSIIAPDQTTAIQVQIAGAVGGTMVPGSARLNYRINGGSWTEVLMTTVSAGVFQGNLPATSCDNIVEFYASAQEMTNGTFTDPSPATPYLAVVATAEVTPFADDFESNLGWTVSGSVTAGAWNRGAPVGGGDRGDPPSDFDGSGQCYLTGSGDGDTDIDGGTTVLTSPTIDLASGDAQISYARWYSNTFGAEPNADVMNIYISNNNGTNWTLVEAIGPVNEADGGWIEHSFMASDFVSPTAQMRMKFEASDLAGGSVVEAGVDAFTVTRFECQSTTLNITTTSLPNWTVGVPFSQQLVAVNFTGVMTWTDGTNGLVGTGLSLSSSGLLSGTPTTAGPISFTALVSDQASAFDNQNLGMTVNPALNIITSSLPAWTAGRPYSQSLLVTGGTGTPSWADKNSDLSGTGLSLSATGAITGTPTSPGSIIFIARVVDIVGGFVEKSLQVQINPAVAIVTTSLPTAVEGEAYSQNLLAQDGTGSKTWTDLNNNLAGTGLTLSTVGLLSGTPLVASTLNFTARVIDVTGSADEQALSLVIALPYVCGDADGNESVDVSDAVYIINYIFASGPAPDPLASGDATCDALVNVSDAVYLIAYIFAGGPAPCSACK